MSQTLNASTLLAVPLAPLVGSVLAGVLGTQFGGNWIGRRLSHSFTILGVLVALPGRFPVIKCSNCGAKIPFSGKVCPWCRASKSGDKLLAVIVAIAMAGGAFWFFFLHSYNLNTIPP